MLVHNVKSASKTQHLNLFKGEPGSPRLGASPISSSIRLHAVYEGFVCCKRLNDEHGSENGQRELSHGFKVGKYEEGDENQKPPQF
jgi:hypothetical protein